MPGTRPLTREMPLLEFADCFWGFYPVETMYNLNY
jgi:hypothetical protein